MPFGYPVFLELAGRRIVVIGDDAIRESRVEALVASGADDILVLASQPASVLDDVAQLEGVTVERRDWEPADLDGAFMCVSASRDADDRDALARESRSRGVLVNVQDDIPNCDWAFPSVVRRGEMILAASTGGASPALAAKLRAKLEGEFGEEWAEIVSIVREVRAETFDTLGTYAARSRGWREALDLDEAVALVREGRADEFASRLRSRLLGEEAPAR